MKSVTIVQPFLFTHNDGRQQQFYPGVHQLDDDIADHPTIVANSDNPVDPVVPVQDVQADHERRRAEKEAVLEAMAEEAKQKVLEEGRPKLDQEMIDEEQAMRDNPDLNDPADPVDPADPADPAAKPFRAHRSTVRDPDMKDDQTPKRTMREPDVTDPATKRKWPLS